VLLQELGALEMTSLGTAEARRVRAGATADRVADILGRHEQIRPVGSRRGASAGGTSVLRILLGVQLRRLRESRGISAHEAARAIRGSESKISRIELGRNAIRDRDVLDLLTFYGADPVEKEQLLSLAEQSSLPDWWNRFSDILPDWFHAYVGMEEAATSIRGYEPQFIPSLLQTPQYTEAVLATQDVPAAKAERHVILRKERQRRFTEGQVKLWAVIEETALRRPVGSKEILLDQLRYLLSLSDTPNLTLQIIPADMATHAVPGGFTILQFSEADLPDVVYLEQLTSALYLDKKSDVDRYLQAMERLSAVSTGPGEAPYILTMIINQLSADGYAASAGSAPAEFPQLCEAETEAFGRLLGTPVQRLATIAHGDGICTTHVTSVGKVALLPGSSAQLSGSASRAADVGDQRVSGQLTMYTTPWCGFCRNLKRQLAQDGIEVAEVDIERDEVAAEFVMSVNGGRQTVPTVVFPDGTVLANPSAAQVRAHLAAMAEVTPATGRGEAADRSHSRPCQR